MAGRRAEPGIRVRGWASYAEDRPDSCLRILRFVDDADMGGDDSPTLREAYPGLHLPPHPSRRTLAIEQRGSDRGVAAIGGDDGLVGLAIESDGRAPRTERADCLVAIEVFADAVAQRTAVVAEQFVEHGD